jgi:hypothetical protein
MTYASWINDIAISRWKNKKLGYWTENVAVPRLRYFCYCAGVVTERCGFWPLWKISYGCQ